MLEGLEASEIKLSNLLNENDTIRIDSEYLKKLYFKNIDSILNFKNGFFKLSKHIKHLSGGATPLGANYFNEGIPFLRVQNIMQNYFNLNDIVYISEAQDEEIKRSILKEKDVLLTITGAFGKSAVVPKELENANINQHSVKITLDEKLNPYFLSTFFNSKFGKLQSDKNVVGITRPALDYNIIRNFIIPNISNHLQLLIEKCVKSAYLVETESQSLYVEAENTLLQELGLSNWQPTIKNSNTKTLKESFLTSGRIDAEYYQPKYDEIESYLSKFERIAIKDLVDYPIVSGSTPTAGESEYYTDVDNGIPFIRAVDIKNSKVSLENVNYIKDEVHNGLLKRTQLRKNDVLVSIAGTVGRSGIYEFECNANINQACAILRFSEKKLNHLYLVILLNSLVGKLIVEKEARQGLQTNLNLQELGSIRIPIIDDKIQKIIAEKIQQSFALLSKSRQLLETAKKAVEIAIEQNENTALGYLNNYF